LMIYAGQEFGERGMDAEGFSGCDGRTTIFDYWSLDSLQHGYFNRKGLTHEERFIETEYKKILAIAKRRVVAEGDFFDLMYVNPKSADFNPATHYAFLRKTDDELLIVVANFDNNDSHVKVVIPAHAFTFMNIIEGEYQAEDLLSSHKQTIRLMRDGNVEVHLKANAGAVLSIKI